LNLTLFWFLAGVLCTLAVLVLLLPWLRTIPRLGPLPSLPWQAGIGAAVVVAAVFGLYHWLGHPDLVGQSVTPATSLSGSAANSSNGSSSAASPSGNAAMGSASAGSPTTKPGAGSMNSAIASLEARLGKGGGTADDWELLAKSYEFLGRPADAIKARARQLPPLPPDAAETAPIPAAAPMASAPGKPSGSGPTMVSAPAKSSGSGETMASAPAKSSGSGAAVSGEVSLAPGLRSRAAAGATLFIVAKSVDSPGIPVAVFRGSVGTWPIKFTLDDSQSMLPGRNLSSAGRVTIEARISQSGQPLPAAGDLQGSTGAINPADHPLLKILIDRVIT
jgi:hypothetical protein